MEGAKCSKQTLNHKEALRDEEIAAVIRLFASVRTTGLAALDLLEHREAKKDKQVAFLPSIS
jgi:hypothetical protein